MVVAANIGVIGTETPCKSKFLLRRCAAKWTMAPSPPAGVPAKRALPSKESTLFKELLALYEAHQLKKALKTADQILKKIPEHGGVLPNMWLFKFEN